MAFTHFVTANRFCYFDQNQRTLFARMLGSSAIEVCRAFSDPDFLSRSSVCDDASARKARRLNGVW